MADVVNGHGKRVVTGTDLRDRARELYEEEGQVEIDGEPTFSVPDAGGDHGAYVQAWVWVPLGPDEELLQPESIAVLA